MQVNTINANKQYGAGIANLSGNRFAVAWTDTSQSADDPAAYVIRCQIFADDGSKVSAEFRVNPVEREIFVRGQVYDATAVVGPPGAIHVPVELSPVPPH